MTGRLLGYGSTASTCWKNTTVNEGVKMENVGKCKRAELPNQENGQCSAGELTDGELTN